MVCYTFAMGMQSRFYILLFLILLVVVGLFAVLTRRSVEAPAPDALPNTPATTSVATASQIQNATYVIGGESFTLVDGTATKSVPGSSAQNILALFGVPTSGDLDGDGDVDAALLLFNQPGGSGTFFYAALAINHGAAGYIPTGTMFLGDRIAPQTVEIHDGRAVFNFAERRPGEPMAAQPSVGKSVWVQYDAASNQIGEWVKDFEGESDVMVRSFEECVRAGYPVMESYPRQCTVPGGAHFTESIPRTVDPAPPQTGPEGVACTMEAKQCPDGSYVGRTGPRCEFAPCP